MRPLRGVHAAAAALLSCGALAACTASAGAQVRLERVGSRFDAPVHVAGAPGDGERLYVVQQGGLVKVVKGGVTATFADLRAVVEPSGEQGLLSIAFPPDFQSSRLLYVYYTAKGGAANVVAELRAPTGDAVDAASRRIVLSIPHPDRDNHNGGQLQFGRDGLLYLAPGDGGTSGANARDFSNLLGKIVRIDPRGGVVGSYTVPADNPYAADGGTRALVWSHGLRNPFRFSFDRATGDLVVGDVGEITTEEIDWLPAASGAGRGADFGWNRCEGSFLEGSPSQPCDLDGSVKPILDKPHADGWKAIVPGFVVRDPSLPSLYGRLVYGDYFKTTLRSAIPAPGGATDDRELPGVSTAGAASFGEDAGGCVYLATADGTVSRLTEGDARIPCAPAPAPGSDGGTAPPPVGDGGAGGGTPPGGSAAAPIGLRVGWERQQRVLRTGGVVVRARCASRCRLTITGTVRVSGRTLTLRRTTRTAGARRHVRLLARLTPRGSAAVRQALRRGGRPAFAIRVRAQPAGGASGRAALRVAAVRARP